MKAKKGCGGVDRVSIKDFDRNLGRSLDEIHRLLKEDRYSPQPVRRVWIPKPNGDKRPLGIPAIKDRVVQQALLNRLQRIFEPKFCDCSFGFRPGRSPRQAIEKIEEYIKEGYQWVVEVDIEKFFDTVNQKKLIGLVAEGDDGRSYNALSGFSLFT